MNKNKNYKDKNLYIYQNFISKLIYFVYRIKLNIVFAIS